MMKNDIRLVALDLDGTCLNTEGRITSYTKDVLRNVGSKGISIVIATGRPLSGVPEELYEIDGLDYIIALNGSRIYDVRKRKNIYVKGLDKKCLEEIPKIIRKYNVLADFFAGDVGYCEKRDYEQAEIYLKDEHFCKYYLSTRKPDVNLWTRNLNEYSPIEKINLFFDDLEEKEKMLNEIRNFPKTKICSGMKYNLEVNHIDVNKGNALEILAGRLDLKLEDVLSIGDGGNDIDMIKKSGIGIAMGNASEKVKEAADGIAENNSEDGVAKALQFYLDI